MADTINYIDSVFQVDETETDFKHNISELFNKEWNEAQTEGFKGSIEDYLSKRDYT